MAAFFGLTVAKFKLNSRESFAHYSSTFPLLDIYYILNRNRTVYCAPPPCMNREMFLREIGKMTKNKEEASSPITMEIFMMESGYRTKGEAMDCIDMRLAMSMKDSG